MENIWVSDERRQEEEFVHTPELISSLVQLCYDDVFLADRIWVHLFPAVWEAVEEETRMTIFHSNDTKAYLMKLSTHQCSENPNFFDSFINAAVKANPEFCFHVDLNYIRKSFSFQVVAKRVLEELFFSGVYSSKDYVPIKLLNKIYTNLEESDLYYCFNKTFVKHYSVTKRVMTTYQNNELFESYKLYTELVEKFNNLSKPNTRYQFEKEFCTTEQRRCLEELMKWDSLDTETTFTDMFHATNLFSKWNIMENGYLSPRVLTNNEEAGLNYLCKDEIQKKCIEKWKTLPTFFSQQHYSLLQLTQQLIQVNEAKNSETEIIQFSNEFLIPVKERTELYKGIDDLTSKWQKRSYLLSDDYQFLTETFQVCFAFLKFFYKRYSIKMRNPSLLECTREYFEEASVFIRHKMNDALVEQCSLALNCRKIHTQNIEFQAPSNGNLCNLFNLKMSYILHDLGPFSNLKFVHKGKIKGKVEYLLDMCYRYLDLPNMAKPSLKMLNTFHDLGLGINFSKPAYFSLQILAAQLYEGLLEQDGKDFDPGLNMIMTSHLLARLLQICSFSDIQDSIKILPKVLQLLEVDDINCVLPPILEKYPVPTQHWLPFLPFLISLLLRELNKEYGISSMEVETCQKNPSLSSVLSNLLIKIGNDFPQEVFFPLYSLKEKEKCCSITEFIFSKGDGACLPCSDIGNVTCEKILFSLKNKNPKLISDLEYLVKDFKVFDPSMAEIHHGALKKLTEEVYNSLFKNLRGDHFHICPADLSSYVIRALRILCENPDIQEVQDLFDAILKEDFHTYPAIFGILLNFLKKSNYFLNGRYRKRSFYLGKNTPVLSNFHHFNEEVRVFGQSPFLDKCYQIKIQKILPKVETKMWGDHSSYKINILGDNGEIYPFLIKEADCHMRTLSRLKCTNMLENINIVFKNYVECAKRFFCSHFPRLTPLRQNLIIVPYHQTVTFYQDIIMCQDQNSGYSPHLHFTTVLADNSELFFNPGNLLITLQSMKSQVPVTTLRARIENIYTCPNDMYLFKKEFTKQLSIMIALEYFLNISVKHELLVHKETGVLSAYHPQINVKNLQRFSLLLTPNIQTFIGPLGLKQVTENVYWIATCLKPFVKILQSYFHTLRMDYLDDDFDEIINPKITLEKFNNVTREDIVDFINLSTVPDVVLQVSPLKQPFF